MRLPTRNQPVAADEKRVLGLFLEWYEALSPEDRTIWEYVMGKSILRVSK